MHTYVVRVYRAHPEDVGSASGIIEDVESGQKESFHSIYELQAILAHSIGKVLHGLPNLAPQESNIRSNVAIVG